MLPLPLPLLWLAPRNWNRSASAVSRNDGLPASRFPAGGTLASGSKRERSAVGAGFLEVVAMSPAMGNSSSRKAVEK